MLNAILAGKITSSMLDGFSLVCIVLCAVIVGWLIFDAKKCIKRGQPSNHATYAVTCGVLFTFIGVTFSLLGFDIPDGGSPDAMVKSVASFLSGMELAFVTSIIGMIGSLYIKKMERGRRNDESDEENRAFQSLFLIEELRDQQAAILTVLRNSNNAYLADDMQRLTNAITQNSNTSVELASMFRQAFADLRENSNRQLDELKKTVASQMQGVNNLAESFRSSINEQAVKLDESNKRMDKISDKFTQMADDTHKMLEVTESFHASQADHAQRMLEESKYFHSSQEALAEANLANMQANTAKMDELCQKFDGFLRDMSEKFSDSFIQSLRKCIENLNDNLKEQFGENFKRLDDAVGKLNAWQQENKEEIARLTAAYGEVYESYTDFVGKQAQTNAMLMGLQDMLNNLERAIQQANEHIEQESALQQSIADTMAQSNALTRQGTELIRAQQTAMEGCAWSLQNTTSGIRADFAALSDGLKADIVSIERQFGESTNSILEGTKDELEKYYEALSDTVKEYVNEINTRSLAIRNATNAFSETVVNSSDGVGKAVGNFTDSWDASLAAFTKTLQQDLLTINQELLNTQDEFNKQLAVNMAAVAGKIAEKYDGVADAINKISGTVANYR